MSTTTYSEIGHVSSGSSIGGWLKRVFWRMAEAQEKAARERVASHFRGQDTEHLVKLGYSAADISRIRRG